MTEWVIVV